MKFFQKNITFLSGGYFLKGILHMPDVLRPSVVIGSHGLLSSGNSPKQIALARQCNEAGLAFFRFDHRGAGQSEGNFYEVTTLASRCQDLASAVKLMQERNDTGDRTGLFGSSMGGAACLSTALELDAEALVVFAAPLRSGPIVDAAASSKKTSPEDLRFYKKNLIFDLSDSLGKLRNILIFHGDEDEIVPPSDAEEIFVKALKPKKLIIQKGGDHSMNNPVHQSEFARESIAWFRRML
ncbi:MAG: alpha/beta hydrolase [Desulfosarcina sp.]|nr:alpha/beta hydrolase [Desulfobacterales bacterium]